MASGALRLLEVSAYGVGILTRLPPFMADSWAQMPVIVQFALVTASGNGARRFTMAVMNSCTGEDAIHRDRYLE